jgi:Protein of unknown function (DUF2946)
VDDIVARSLAKWPDVPAVYGWLSLDRRGNWRIKGQTIGNAALREFIGRNYEADEKGRWYFQNGPQRVYVALAYTPLVVHYEGERLVDHCGRPFTPTGALQDDEGSVLFAAARTVGLLDDRDLARLADRLADRLGDQEPPALTSISRAEVAGRFGFVAEPKPD